MSYKVEIESLKNCVVEEYDRRKKKVVWFYKLKSNQLIIRFVDNENRFTWDLGFSYVIHKYPYRASIYLESALVDLEDEILKKINEYKRLFPKRKNALITIYKIS